MVGCVGHDQRGSVGVVMSRSDFTILVIRNMLAGVGFFTMIVLIGYFYAYRA